MPEKVESRPLTPANLRLIAQYLSDYEVIIRKLLLGELTIDTPGIVELFDIIDGHEAQDDIRRWAKILNNNPKISNRIAELTLPPIESYFDD